MVSHPNRNKSKHRKLAAAPAPRDRRKHDHEHDYSGLLNAVSKFFASVTMAGVVRPLFRTDVEGDELNKIYLRGIPLAERQVHDCSACRRFIRKFGGLVYVDENGRTRSAIWNPDWAPAFYKPAFVRLKDRAEKALVQTVFLTSEETWGQPATGAWHHLAIRPPEHLVYRLRTGRGWAWQAAAVVRENFGTVARALEEFPPDLLDKAIAVFDGGHVNASERYLAPARWLRRLHDRLPGLYGDNQLWFAVASAPDGYCHPRSSVLGTLLEDLQNGVPLDKIRRKFNVKVDPINHQRPKAAPSAGNIAAAEKMVANLGIERSLERRYARRDEVEALWRPFDHVAAPMPTIAAKVPARVFGHLKPKGAPTAARNFGLPESTMTWVKFRDSVLAGVERLEMHVPAHGDFAAIVTARHEDAPPIIRWDREEERNPASMYVYHGGSPARRWSINADCWNDVTTVCSFPQMWGSRPQPHHGDGVLLILRDCVDTNEQTGGALFPSFIRDDLHSIRSTIEAYSATAKISDRKQASACGYALATGKCDVRLRAFASGIWAPYRIDRWD